MFAELSKEIADVVASVGPSVVQVQGRRRPVSGLVHAPDSVLTTTRALGRSDTLRVRRQDGAWLDAELAGWDVATQLAVLTVKDLDLSPVRLSSGPPQVGQLAVAVARSWSNAVTASLGIVAVIGGPLPTGPRRAIERIVRTTAPMHDGFSGGAFVDPSGGVVGVATAASIRGLGIVIPADIAMATAQTIVRQGRRRGYLGVAGQAVRLPDSQRIESEGEALLVVGVTEGGPAAAAGLLVGDLLLAFDGHPLASPEDLLTLLTGETIGRPATLRVRRGIDTTDLQVTVGERPSHDRVS
jgi:S1-C subfamily serine protease